MSNNINSDVQVEKTGVGDETRLWGPPFVGPPNSTQSCYFLSVNRNKASLALDIKKQPGTEILKKLATKYVWDYYKNNIYTSF